MDIHSIRQALRTKSVYDIPLRVTFYARVSSESDEQLNSLGNQVSYYEEFIRKNSAWEYVPGYVDEGLSAATTKKREDFHRMVEDGKAGLFDLIITKEITRFARNTLDSILYTRELLSAGVGVFFQNDNINTFDEDSELRLTIMSGIAQDELRKLSGRVKFGHAQAIKNGVVLGNSRIFGYVKDGGRLVIDEDEAPMVRELFELYATGGYSMKQIETLFWEKGYRNHNGKKIAHTTMSGMISNPKYKGYYVGNKVKVIDLFTKKQKFLPPEEWVMFKDETGEIVPAIVSEELWDRANAVLKKRSEDVKGRQGICNHANLLTGKLYCTHCGAAYYRRESVDRQGNKNSKWVCSGKIKNGADSCPSFPVYEEELKPLLFEVFRETEADAQALVEEYIEMYKALGDGEDTAKQIAALRQQIELAQKKKSKLLGYNAAGQLSDRDFLSMNKDCDREISEAERQIYDLEQQQMSRKDFRKQIETIRRVLREAERDAAQGLISKEFVDRYIDKIFSSPEEDGSLRLQIKVFTGETTDKYLANLRSRTGHTFNVLIQPTDEKILRNRDVIDRIGHAAQLLGANIILEGGILSHAYYQLVRTGAKVEVRNTFGKTQSLEFNKLVRDKIPEKIEKNGEQAVTAQLEKDILIRLLKRKLVEESLEVLDAKDTDDLIAELADVMEVIDSIVKQKGIVFQDILDRKEKKRKKAGGFEKGVYLKKTSNNTEISTGTIVVDSDPVDIRQTIAKSTDLRKYSTANESFTRIKVPVTMDDWEIRPSVKADSIDIVIKGERKQGTLQIEISVFEEAKQMSFFEK